jgi:hypothetical protein
MKEVCELDEQEELQEVLRELPPTGRAFLGQYFRSNPEARAEMRGDLERSRLPRTGFGPPYGSVPPGGIEPPHAV